MRQFESKQALPSTENAAKTVLSLPVHPAVTEGDLQKIATTVKSVNTQ